MITVVDAVDVRCEPDRAFAYVADLSNTAAWDPGISRSRRTTRDGAGEEAAYVMVAPVGPVPLRVRHRVVRCEAPTRLVTEGRAAGTRVLDDIRFSPADGGTRIRYQASYELPGPARILQRPARGILRSRLTEALQGMKEALERATADRRGQRVAMRASDGTALAGLWWPSPGSSTALVFSPGLGMLASSDDVEALAHAANNSGVSVLSYDPRGHGDSDGVATLGRNEQHDVAAAIAEAQGRGADRIVLAGMSTGAIATFGLLASWNDGSGRPDAVPVAGVVSLACPSRWHRPHSLRAIGGMLLTRTLPGRVLADRTMHMRLARSHSLPEPPLACITRVHCPVSIVHGLHDPYLRSEEAVELYDRAPGPKRLHLVPGLGHELGPSARSLLGSEALWAVQQP